MNAEISATEDTRPVFKALCVDGGGFKGLSTAAALKMIEEQNGRLLDHFDLLCGTSTGALIVLSIAAGKRADEIVEFYRKRGPEIFPRLSRWKQWQHMIRMAASENKHKYSNVALKTAIEDILEDKQMRDAGAFVCVPALNVTTFSPRVFKTDHDAALTRDGNRKMSDVALASSAAPGLFPITSSEESGEAQYFADGGLWANDPTMVGLTEAIRFFAGPDKPYKGVALLSIGCSTGVGGRMARSTYPKLAHDFALELVAATGEAQQKSTQFYVNFLQDAFNVPVHSTRIDLNPLSAAQAKSVSLDTATQQAIETLIQLGCDTGHNWKSRPEIRAFFDEPAPKIGLRPNVS